MVHTLEISDDNTFSFQVPPDYGKILITGFIDKAGNGPTPDDPQGRLSIEIGAEEQTGVILEISDDYTPPTPPGGGAPEKNQPPKQGQPQDGEPQDGGQPQNGPSQGGQPPEGQPNGTPPQGGNPGEVAPSQGQPGEQQETQNPPKEQDGPPADDG